MGVHPASDEHVGAFTPTGPWIVVPEQMAWRRGIDDLRASAQARVPDLIRPRRLPPAHGLKVAARLARAVAPPVLRYRKRLRQPEAQQALAGNLRVAFESLGTTFIKLGQLVASSDGMLPDILVQEFKLCRDRVPAEPFSHVRAVVEEDLGRPFEEIFASFDPVPMAAASIAQVHTARLRTGEEVVVKVQRPRIDRIVPSDIATMAWIIPIVEKRARNASFANLRAYVELFAETIVEELDFRLEAQNMLDIAQVLARTDQRAVVVPRPHPELVTRRVLVMERLHGFGIDEEAAMIEAGVDPSPVFRTLMVSFLEGAMIHGVFHGDLHGGNMLVTHDGRPALLDFGITGRLSEQKRAALLGLMMTMTTQDGRAVLRFFRDLGGFPPHADLDRIADEIDMDGLMAQNPAEIAPEQMALQMRETMNRLVAHGAHLPKEMFLYMKCMVYLNGAIAALAADIDMFSEMGHVYETFTGAHGDYIETVGVDREALPRGAEGLAEMMRRQSGIDSESATVRDLHKTSTERMDAIRAAQRRQQRGLDE